VILIFLKYDGLTYHTSKYEIYIFSNVYRNKKYKAKLRTAFISSYLIPFKEFGPTSLPFQEESMIPLHLLKSMVNMNMKWRTF
jgi:hypothetical protein